MEHENHLYILWTDDNPITADKMMFMYGINSLKNGWWEQVTIIVWGAAAQLASRHLVVQQRIQEALAAGAKLTACKACADQLGITESLEGQGIEVEYLGETLTEILRSGKTLLTI
jgi:hypothetical protein